MHVPAPTAGKIAIALALEAGAVLLWHGGRIGPIFLGLCTLAFTAFAWPRLAHALGVANTAILLTLVYVLAAGPMKLYRLFTRRPEPAGSRWKARREPDPALPERQRMKFQF